MDIRGRSNVLITSGVIGLKSRIVKVITPDDEL